MCFWGPTLPQVLHSTSSPNTLSHTSPNYSPLLVDYLSAAPYYVTGDAMSFFSFHRFSLKTLLVASTLVAALGGLIRHQMNWIEARQAERESGRIIHHFKDAWAPALLGFFGERGYGHVGIFYRTEEQWISEKERIAELFPEANIVRMGDRDEYYSR